MGARRKIETGPLLWFVLLCVLAGLLGLLAVPMVRLGGDHIVHGLIILEVGPDPFEASISRFFAWCFVATALVVALGAAVLGAKKLRGWTAVLPFAVVGVAILIGFASNQVPFETCHMYFSDCVRPEYSGASEQ